MIRKKIKEVCKTPELIENYEEAVKSDKKYICHHRLETHFSDGTPRPKNAQLTYKELIALGTYWNRPPEELIFVSTKEHRALHDPWNKGKKGVQPKSEETKRKTSETLKAKGGNSTSWKKGHTPWNKGIPGPTKGKHRYTNGIINVYEFECPEGFWKGWVKKCK